MGLCPGSAITPHVRLRRPLGHGGMGSVWVAEHLTLHSEVAVKFIARDRTDPQHQRRFEREATLAAQIKSPHVVRIFDHGVAEGGIPYIVMELLEGTSLALRLERRGPLNPDQTELVVAQVGEALASAHRLGIVHRDIKPSNLFLVDSGYELFVKVLDFGIAKQQAVDAAADITETGALLGTPLYMSPEMLLAPKTADHRADLWALAVVAYHALTGVPPFQGQTPASLAFAIEEGRLAPPSSRIAGLEPELDAWFKIALCRDLELRYPTADALVESFRAAVRGEAPALPSRPSGAAEQASHDLGAEDRTIDDDDESTVPDEPASRGSTERSDFVASGPTSLGLNSTVTAPIERPSKPSAAPSTFAGSTAARPAPARPASAWLRAVALIALGAVAVLLGTRLASSPEKETAADPTAAEGATSLPQEQTSVPLGATTPPAPEDTATHQPESAPSAETPHQPRSPAPGPPATAEASSSPATVPDQCDEPFLVDQDGDLIPKPECLSVPKPK